MGHELMLPSLMLLLSELCCSSSLLHWHQEAANPQKRWKAKEKKISWLLLCLLWLLLSWGSSKYYHPGPGFNCSRFFLWVCRALLASPIPFLYIQAKHGICFHLQQDMQPEAERSPVTRAEGALCPGRATQGCLMPATGIPIFQIQVLSQDLWE